MLGHNDLTDLKADFVPEVCHTMSTEPELQSLLGEVLHGLSDSKESISRETFQNALCEGFYPIYISKLFPKLHCQLPASWDKITAQIRWKGSRSSKGHATTISVDVIPSEKRVPSPTMNCYTHVWECSNIIIIEHSQHLFHCSDFGWRVTIRATIRHWTFQWEWGYVLEDSRRGERPSKVNMTKIAEYFKAAAGRRLSLLSH